MLQKIPTWIVATVAALAVIATFAFFYLGPNEPKVSEGDVAAGEVWDLVNSTPDWDINDPVVTPTSEKSRWTFRANVAHGGSATLLPAIGFVDFNCQPDEDRAACWKITEVRIDNDGN